MGDMEHLYGKKADSDGIKIRQMPEGLARAIKDLDEKAKATPGGWHGGTDTGWFDENGDIKPPAEDFVPYTITTLTDGLRREEPETESTLSRVLLEEQGIELGELPSPTAEAARLGIDPEVYLEG